MKFNIALERETIILNRDQFFRLSFDKLKAERTKSNDNLNLDSIGSLAMLALA